MVKFEGAADRAARFFQETQLSDTALWAKFADQFRARWDSRNNGWRGEYWGKMMRGGALVCGYTGDGGLYDVLTASVEDMLTTADPDGRVSSYERSGEFDGWDIWSRKYVMLGCEYYLEICRDGALRERVLAFLKGLADCVLAAFGPGKRDLLLASRHWRGMNSASILEPMARLYRLTGEARYLDFASYIVKSGGAYGRNIFEMAYENRLAPYQYGTSKAYEMTSCFEGLLEYYEATGIEKYRVAAENYGRALLATEVSVIGSCGVTHELFDHTRTRQTVKVDGVMQETCVTVTWMKFCARLLALTGDSRFADEMERSFYNAYLGALNTERRECRPRDTDVPPEALRPTFLPADSYSPLTPGKRGQMVGGAQRLPDDSYYGCCACISAAGAGIFLRNAVVADGGTVTVNFFERGEASFDVDGVPVRLRMETAYPLEGEIALEIRAERPVRFLLKVRNPGWADGPGGYVLYEREWSEDRIGLSFDMPLRIHRPEHWDRDVIYTNAVYDENGRVIALPKEVVHAPEEDGYAAVTRGPLVLAADSRTGKSADSPFRIRADGVRAEPCIAEGVPCMLRYDFPDGRGGTFALVDYASAGKDWQTVIAAWLPVED